MLDEISQQIRNLRVGVRDSNLDFLTIEAVVQKAPPRLACKTLYRRATFANLSGDPEQEYFADGITEDIITALSQFKSLFVIARNLGFTFQRQSDRYQAGRTRTRGSLCVRRQRSEI